MNCVCDIIDNSEGKNRKILNRFMRCLFRIFVTVPSVDYELQIICNALKFVFMLILCSKHSFSVFAFAIIEN